MGRYGMAEHGGHVAMGLKGPENTLPMMTGEGLYGPIEMGGMFTVVKVRDNQPAGDYRDPGWYRNPPDKIARRISSDPDYGNPPRRDPYGPRQEPAATPAIPKMDHSQHGG
jgi:hypothetical protein